MIKKQTIDYLYIKDIKGHRHFGASQYWYKHKFHALSGCGPTTAAEQLAFLARKHPKACAALYAYNIDDLKDDDFVLHMDRVRDYVKPGIKGLTSVDFYEKSTKAFAASRGVKIAAKRIPSETKTEAAFENIKASLKEGYPLAMLILRNPHPEINDYTWHWMNIVGYDEEKMHIFIATYGRKAELSFKKAWHQKPGYFSEIITFRPGDV